MKSSVFLLGLTVVLSSVFANALEISQLEEYCIEQLKSPNTLVTNIIDPKIPSKLTLKRYGEIITKRPLGPSDLGIGLQTYSNESDIEIRNVSGAGWPGGTEGPRNLYNVAKDSDVDWVVVKKPTYKTTFSFWIFNRVTKDLFFTSVQSRRFPLAQKKILPAVGGGEPNYMANVDLKNLDCGFTTEGMYYMDWQKVEE